MVRLERCVVIGSCRPYPPLRCKRAWVEHLHALICANSLCRLHNSHLPFQLKWKERQWIQVKGSERKGHEQKLKHAHIQKLGLASTSSNNTVFTTTFINHFGLLGGSSLYLLTLSLALPHQFDLICPYGCTSVQSLLSRTSCNPIPNSSLTNLHKESGSWHSAKALRCIYMECGIQ